MDHYRYRKILLWRPVADIIKETAHARNIRVPFTLKYIEKVLSYNKQYEVVLIDSFAFSTFYDEVVRFTLQWVPDLIAICPTTAEYRLSLDYVKTIKKKITPFIVALGQDPSAEPERYVFGASGIDAVLGGESELSFTSLVEGLNADGNIEKVKGCYRLSNKDKTLSIVKDLDSLPFISYSNKELKQYTLFYPLRMRTKAIWGHILTSRGCPYDCIFCSQAIRESYGRRLRFRNPVKVVDEIRYLKSLGANVFSFADDNFTTSAKHVNNICKAIVQSAIDIKWTAHARVDNMTEELMLTMKEAGCIQLRFGIESGSARILKNLKKTNNGKAWIDKAQGVFDSSKKIGLATVALFLAGSPGETEEDLEKSIRFAQKLDPDIAQIHFFTAYPGSAAYKQFKDKFGMEYLNKLYHYKAGPINLSVIESNSLKYLYGKFYRSFYLRIPYLIKHILRYGIYYLCNIKVFLELLKTGKSFINSKE